MPQRVCSLASRQPEQARTRPKATSSQRHTSVSVVRQVLQFLAERKGAIECARRIAGAVPARRTAPAPRALPAAAKPAISPSTSARSSPPMPVISPARIDARDTGLLHLVHRHARLAHAAAQQRGQFQVRRQAEAARQVIARFRPRLPAAPQRDTLQFLRAPRLHRPAAGQVRNAQETRAQLHRLRQFAGVRHQSDAEAQQCRLFRLLGDQQDFGAVRSDIAPLPAAADRCPRSLPASPSPEGPISPAPAIRPRPSRSAASSRETAGSARARP